MLSRAPVEVSPFSRLTPFRAENCVCAPANTSPMRDCTFGELKRPTEIAASKEEILETVKLEVAIQTEEAQTTKPERAVESTSPATPKKANGVMKTAMNFLTGVAVGLLIGYADSGRKKESKEMKAHKLSITYS